MSAGAGAAPPAAARRIQDAPADLTAAAALVQESWNENEQALLYTPSFLASALAYPGAGPSLAASSSRPSTSVRICR